MKKDRKIFNLNFKITLTLLYNYIIVTFLNINYSYIKIFMLLYNCVLLMRLFVVLFIMSKLYKYINA